MARRVIFAMFSSMPSGWVDTIRVDGIRIRVEFEILARG
jgi:hypothetical protein